MSLQELSALFTLAQAETADMHLRDSGSRYAAWLQQAESHDLLPNEQLLPQILCDCPDTLPPFMQNNPAVDTPELRASVSALQPWDFWFQVAPGLTTNDNRVTRNRMLCRSGLISATVARLLGPRLARSRILDMGSHSGFFSFDLASRGAASVTGVELREENLAQARFLQKHYGLNTVHFVQGDVCQYRPRETYDVVLNLGLLYHVINPIELVRQTYDLCKDFSVIDTVCHKEPISAYIAAFNKDINGRGEGRHTAELHPTYRALIDSMHDAGFVDLVELTAYSGLVAGIYRERRRRCIIGFKRPLADILHERQAG